MVLRFYTLQPGWNEGTGQQGSREVLQAAPRVAATRCALETVGVYVRGHDPEAQGRKGRGTAAGKRLPASSGRRIPGGGPAEVVIVDVPDSIVLARSPWGSSSIFSAAVPASLAS
jgi:hypothetical protein